MDRSLSDRLRADAEIGAARAAAGQDRDPYSPTRGCFDRRFWAWKLVDFPEATFQRLVYPLSRLYHDPASRFYRAPAVEAAVVDGLNYATVIQHRDGSFDQAFPHEHSWGATAFLLHPLIEAFERHRAAIDAADGGRIENCVLRAAGFLARRVERHGTITNHLAGGALSLLAAGDALGEASATAAGEALLARILQSQSREGWFPEYDGADPGYQTLALYYLAEIRARRPSAELDRSIARALDFLQWFVHPDGSFGGVYGSRRTSIPYLGGLALLAADFPVARVIYRAVASPVAGGRALSAATVDLGNLAAVLTNVVCAAQTPCGEADEGPMLPCDRGGAVDFPGAGLFVRSSNRRFAIIGASNGGTVLVFDRSSRARLFDDGGYVAKTSAGALLTTQVTAPRAVDRADGAIAVEVRFCRMVRAVPTPAQFLLIRILNLSVMRSIAVGNVVKRVLVRRLMTAGRPSPVVVTRRVRIDDGGLVAVEDEVRNPTRLRFASLACGRPFSAIHMASAGYHDPRGSLDGLPRAVGPDLTAVNAGRATSTIAL